MKWIYKPFHLFSFNFEKEVKPIYPELYQEAVEQRTFLEEANSFPLKASTHGDFLYKLFISSCRKFLKTFSLIPQNYKVWCHVSDKTFSRTSWHNHIPTSTINGVLYLKTVPKAGIEFELGNASFYYEPASCECIVFPNYLDHCPHTSKTEEKKISLNLELRCKESAKMIFKSDNYSNF